MSHDESQLLFPMVFKGQKVRTIIDERDQSFWAHAGDVGAVLGIGNIRDALGRIKSSWKKGVGNTDTLGGPQTVTFISEQAIYKLAFTSRKPEAEAFTERIAELLTKLRKGELELRPRAQGLLEHTSESRQKQNSILFNRQRFLEGGEDACKIENAVLCKHLSDKHLLPSEYQALAKGMGLPSKERTSGQQVLRTLEPWSASACSAAKNMVDMGVPKQEALYMANDMKAIYARLLKFMRPKELDESMQ